MPPPAKAVLPTPAGDLRIITATQSIMDRLIAAASWQDIQAVEQAKLVAEHQADKVDWSELDAWVIAEAIGNTREVIDFYAAVRRSEPPSNRRADVT